MSELIAEIIRGNFNIKEIIILAVAGIVVFYGRKLINHFKLQHAAGIVEQFIEKGIAHEEDEKAGRIVDRLNALQKEFKTKYEKKNMIRNVEKPDVMIIKNEENNNSRATVAGQLMASGQTVPVFKNALKTIGLKVTHKLFEKLITEKFNGRKIFGMQFKSILPIAKFFK